MHSLKESFVGILVIIALVVIATWPAHDPERPQAGGEIRTPAPQISVKRLDWSADGRKLLSQSRGHANAEIVLTLHDIEQNFRMPIDVPGEQIVQAALAPDGLHVLVGTLGGKILRIDVESRETVTLDELPYPLVVSAMAVSSDGRLIAAATDTGQIFLGDTQRPPLIEVAPAGESSVTDVCFSQNGERLASAGRDGLIAVWDVPTATRLRVFAGHPRPATAALFLADGKRVISAGLDDTVRVWDIGSGREEWRGEFGLLRVNMVAVSLDGMTAACGGGNHKIVVWDLERQEKKFEILTPASTTFHLAFSPDGHTLAATGNEPTIRRYDARTGVEQEGLAVGRRLNQREDVQ